MQKIRKVLIIAYSFPPVGSGRSLRALKFTKFLPQYGWHPIVLTPRKPIAPELDLELTQEIEKDVKVYRTRSLELIRTLNSSWKSERFHASIVRKIGLYRVFKFLVDNIFIPDSRIGWLPFAVWYGFRIIKKERVRAIMVISEPYSSLLAGALLKFLSGLPLLVDFRDEWIPLLSYRGNLKLRVVVRLEEAMEKSILKVANIVTVTTEEIRDNFQRRYPEYHRKFYCVSNGYDSDDYTGLLPSLFTNGKFIMTYTGILYKKRFPQAFFNAFAKLIDEYPSLLQSTQIIIAGNIDDYSRKFFNDYKYKEIVSIIGHVSFKQTQKYLMASDILFLQSEIEPEIAARYIPAKVYEYIGTGKMIIALANEGSLKNLLEQNNLGMIFNIEDVTSIKNTLKQMLIDNKKLTPIPTANREIFTRKYSTRKLVSLLNSLVYYL